MDGQRELFVGENHRGSERDRQRNGQLLSECESCLFIANMHDHGLRQAAHGVPSARIGELFDQSNERLGASEWRLRYDQCSDDIWVSVDGE